MNVQQVFCEGDCYENSDSDGLLRVDCLAIRRLCRNERHRILQCSELHLSQHGVIVGDAKCRCAGGNVEVREQPENLNSGARKGPEGQQGFAAEALTHAIRLGPRAAVQSADLGPLHDHGGIASPRQIGMRA